MDLRNRGELDNFNVLLSGHSAASQNIFITSIQVYR